MLKVQQFIEEHDVDTLTRDYGIIVKQYETERVAVFNYDGIDSPKTDPIVAECRGLILSMDDCSVVSRSFDRFFNFGEAGSESFDFNGATAYKKADGSLVKIYWSDYKDEWVVSTRGTAFAEGPHPHGETFDYHIRRSLGCDEVSIDGSHYEWTFLFEWCSPINRIVTPYDSDMMVLLGARNNISGEFICPSDADAKLPALQYQTCECYQVDSIEECHQLMDGMGSLEEGLVVVSANGDRIKIKKSTYVAAHRLRGEGSLTPKNIANLVLTGESDEYLTYFPSDAQMFTPYIDVLVAHKPYINKVFNMLTHDSPNQKEFAQRVLPQYADISGLLFHMGRHNVDAVSAFAQLKVNKQIDLLCKWVRPLVVDEFYPHVEINGTTYHATDNDQFIYPLVHEGKYIPTTTCLCYAHSSSECCCGAWVGDE